jgi:DNA-binding CsgD family transcriptional regulator
MAVHHVDGNRSNNAPENLAVMTHAEHNAIHGLRTRTIDRDQIRQLYKQGMSTVEIGSAIGRNPAAVWRALKNDGVAMRARADCIKSKRTDISPDEVETLIRGGLSPDRVAERLGCSSTVIRRIVKLRNLPRRGPGRPPVKK